MNWEIINVGIVVILLGLVGFGVIISIAYAPIFYETHIEEVDCYDKNDNLIQGIRCDDKVYNNSFIEINIEVIQLLLMIFIFFSVIFIFLGLVTLYLGFTTSEDVNQDKGVTNE